MRIEGEKWARKTSSTSTAEITIQSIRLGGLSLRCPRGMQVKMSKKPSGWGRGGVQNSEGDSGFVRHF